MRKGTMRGLGEQSEAAAIALGDTPMSEREVSSSRARILDVVPIAWLDQLLLAGLDLPLSSGEQAVVESLVNSVAAILPSYAVGACFVPQPGAVRKESTIVKRLPEDIVEHATDAERRK